MNLDGDPSQSYFELVLKTFMGAGLVEMFPFGMYSTYQNVSQGRARRNWTEITMTIVKSEVVVDHAGPRTSYQPTVAYRYKYEGKTYTATRIAFHRTESRI